MAKQKYEWGWISRFPDDGEVFEVGEGYSSKAEVLQEVQLMRAEEKKSLEDGFQTKETLIRYTVRRRPAPETPPPWEEVSG